MCHSTQWDREGGGSPSEIPEVKCAPEEGLEAWPSLDFGWSFVSKPTVNPAGLGGNQSTCPIEQRDAVHGLESHRSHLRAGFSKHRSAGDTGQMGTPGGGGGDEDSLLGKEGSRHCHLVSLCARLTRGSW